MAQIPCEQRLVGGCQPPLDANPEIQKICDEVKVAAEEAAGKKFEVFEAKSFTQQVVCGTNYFIKVHVGGEDYVHLRVHKALSCHGGALSLSGHQLSKTHNEPIGHF